MAGTRLVELVAWQPRSRAVARAIAADGPAPCALAAFESLELLGGLLAATAEPQAARARHMAPDLASDPVALLAASRSLRFYLPLEPGSAFEVEATLLPDAGELVVVQAEARCPNGDRSARGELRFLLVPGAGEHAREARARDAVRAGLAGGPW